jgi:hypothetical protein
MAIRFAVQAGNWSNVDVWNGGTLPGVNDDVYSNTFLVDIDIDITVLSISNRSASGVTAGGGFRTVGDRTLTCDVYGPELATVNNNITLTTFNGNVGTDTVVINGNIFGSIVSGFNYALQVDNDDDVTINGNVDNNHNVINIQTKCIGVNAGSTTITKLTVNGGVFNRGAASSTKITIVGSVDTLITINGNVEQYLGGSNAFVISTPGDIIATGTKCRVQTSTSVFAGTRASGLQQTFTLTFDEYETNTASGYILAFTSELSECYLTGRFVSSGAGTANRISFVGNGKIFYTGDIYAFSNNTIDAPVDLLNNIELYIYGNVYGSNTSAQRAINFTTAANGIKLFLYGNAFNGTFSPSFGAFQQISCAIICDNGQGEIDGNIMAICDGGLSPAIAARGTKCVIEECISSDLGLFPVIGRFQVRNGVSVLKMRNESFQEVSYTDQSVSDYPDENNVRDGVEYGFSLEGNLIVPPSGNVSLNYNYDSNGSVTGSAILTPQDLFTAITDSPDPIAERLRNVSTVETTGDQIVAFFP